MEFLVPPWRHQLEALKTATEPHRKGYALFFEMGAGKTGTAINILRAQINARKRMLRTLIFCPPIVVRNWKDEFAKHSRIPADQVVPLVGSGTQRFKTFLKHAYEEGRSHDAGEPRAAIFITNYEALLMPDLYASFLQWGPEVLIFDESHKLKAPAAKRSKLAEKLANPWDQKAKKPLEKPLTYLLTGTPVLNSPMDLFQQYLIMDGGQTFGENFFAFRLRFFRDLNAKMPRAKYFPNWQIRAGAVEEINGLISRTSMRVEKKDCLDLPPFVREVLRVPLTPEQKRLYLEMREDFITFMKDKAVTAPLAMTKAMRLMQIASGYVKTAEGEEIGLEATPKQAALKDLLEELTPNHKVLVWAVWKQNYQQIRQVCEELGLKYVEVHGEVSPTQKDEGVRAFNTDPGTRVLIGHPGSGGIGINLVVASYSIFYSRTFSLEHSLQAEARNYRGGSKEAGHDKVTRIDLVCEDTIDELVSEKLAQKIDMSDKLLGTLAEEL